MPVIPRITTPTVDAPIVAQPRAQAVDVSSGLRQVGRAVGQVGQQVAAFGQRRDEASAESALLDFDNDKNESLFNPNDGYYNTQGRAAVDGADGIRKNIDELMRQHRDGIESPGAKALFQSAANARMVRDNEAIFRHSSKGQRVWQLSNSKAQEGNAIKNATLYYNDDQELLTHLSLGELAILDRQELIGQEQTQRDLEAYRSTFVSSAIDGALSRKDVPAAESLKEQFGKMLEGSDLIRINEKITKEQDKQAVTRSVAEIYQPGKPLNEMLAEARAEENPDQRKEIERQITNLNSADQRATEQFNNDIINNRDQQISNGDMFYRDVPQEELDSIGPKGRDALLAAEQAFATGKEIITDSQKYTDLMSLPTADLAKVNPTDHYTYLNKTDRSKLQNAVIAARNGNKDNESTRIQSASAQTKGTIEQLLGRPINKKRDAEFVNEFYGLVGDQVNAMEQQKGSKLTDQEFRGALDNLVQTVVTDKGFFFDTTRDLTNVPPQHFDILASELRKRGISVNSENMIKLFQASVKAGILDD
jgi:ElaB/YqjD/DUF883 family membrane-anchored ribosome-binding protein